MLPSLQLGLALLLDETYIVRMTVNVYSALWHVKECMSASMSIVRITVQVVSRYRKKVLSLGRSSGHWLPQGVVLGKCTGIACRPGLAA